MAYTYDPLSNEHFEIRLVTIEYADGYDAPVCLHLKHVDLATEPYYWALSYTWGRPAPNFDDDYDNPSSLKPVKINDEHFNVRYNLFSALLAIREKQPPRAAWWIDALCIDQSNTLERNRQVARMKDIYAQSWATLVWLGPSDDLTQTAFDKIRSLSDSFSKRPRHLQETVIRTEDITDYSAFLRREFSGENPIHSWYTLKVLGSRSWFSRAWVVQELCVSSIAIVQCGEYNVRWEDLMYSHRTIAQHAATMGLVVDFNVAGAVEVIRDTFAVTDDLSTFEYGQNIFSDSDLTAMTGTGLVTVLNRLRCMQTTEPHDKVYAALGLAGTDREMIPVDYDLPVASVFVGVAERSISTSQSLCCLAYCSYPPKLAGLPTWAPDWSETMSRTRYLTLPHKGSYSYLPQLREPLYQVSLDSALYAFFADNGRRLILRAGNLGNLAFVASCGGTSYNYFEIIKKTQFTGEDAAGWRNLLESFVYKVGWLREWATSQAATESGRFPMIYRPGWSFDPMADNESFATLTYKPTDEDLLEAYIRTLLADAFRDLTTKQDMRISNVEQHVMPDQRHGVVSRGQFTVRLLGRVLGISEAGYLCLVPAEACVGDMIAIVQGAEHPLILREVSPKIFHFIGLAYVHGVMDGEIWDTMKDQLEEISII
ncbi:MAG: hypothetical protein Q9220_005555 [cf. Caloplaca sp. 1 TL-2023]